jgi:hypothetical protein
MPRYDFSKCRPESLNEFFNRYSSIRENDWKPAAWDLFIPLRNQALVKTRAYYDREIGYVVRGELSPPYGINYWEWDYYINLVKASKEAPEE